MSDQKMIAELQAQLAAIQNNSSGWNQSAAGTQSSAANPAPVGMSVPVSLQTPLGKVRVYLNFPAQFSATPEKIMETLENLASAGYPLDAWQPKQSAGGGWNRNRGGGYGGGYGGGGFNNRGGW